MKREELLKRTKKELLALAVEKGARLSAKLRKSELVDQLMALLSPRSKRASARATATLDKAPRRSARAHPDSGAKGRANSAPKVRPSSTPKAIKPEELHRISEDIGRLFPPPFEHTEIVLYEIDPFHAHTFWHVRLDDLESARRSLGPGGDHAALLLRFYDVTLIDFNGSNAHSWFDVAVHSLQSNYYAEFWESGRAYIVDIGLRMHDGRFLTLARSNHIELPPHAPSDNFDRVGIVVDKDINVICEVADVTRAETLADIRPEPHPDMEAETSDDLVRSFYRQLTDQGPPTPPRGRRLRQATEGEAVPESAGPQSASPPEPQSDSGMPHPAAETYLRSRAENHVDIAAPRESDRSPAPRYHAHLVFKPDPASGDTPASASTHHIETSSYSVYTSANRPEGLSSWALNSSGNPSSWVTSPGAGAGETVSLEQTITLPPEELERSGGVEEFCAELVIQGRVKPGNQLLLMGQPVRLRPDGTFYVRKRLPDGTMVVPLLRHTTQSEDPGAKGGAS